MTESDDEINKENLPLRTGKVRRFFVDVGTQTDPEDCSFPQIKTKVSNKRFK